MDRAFPAHNLLIILSTLSLSAPLSYATYWVGNLKTWIIRISKALAAATSFTSYQLTHKIIFPFPGVCLCYLLLLNNLVTLTVCTVSHFSLAGICTIVRLWKTYPTKPCSGSRPQMQRFPIVSNLPWSSSWKTFNIC